MTGPDDRYSLIRSSGMNGLTTMVARYIETFDTLKISSIDTLKGAALCGEKCHYKLKLCKLTEI